MIIKCSKSQELLILVNQRYCQISFLSEMHTIISVVHRVTLLIFPGSTNLHDSIWVQASKQILCFSSHECRDRFRVYGFSPPCSKTLSLVFIVLHVVSHLLLPWRYKPRPPRGKMASSTSRFHLFLGFRPYGVPLSLSSLLSRCSVRWSAKKSGSSSKNNRKTAGKRLGLKCGDGKHYNNTVKNVAVMVLVHVQVKRSIRVTS